MDNNRFKTKNSSDKKLRSTDGFVRNSNRVVRTPGLRSGVQTRRTRRTVGQSPGALSEGYHSVQQSSVDGDPLKAQRTHAQESADIESITLDLPEQSGARKPRKKRAFTFITKSFATVFIASILIFGYVAGKGYLKLRNSFNGDGIGAAALQNDIDPAILNGEGDGRVNILMLGRGGEGHEAPDLTDTLIVASIDPLENQATLLSIPRDLYIDSGYGYTKINAVYVNAKNRALYEGKSEEDSESQGLEAIESVVSEHMGIPIHYHVMVNFQAFKQAVDTVGGVDIDVPDAVYDVMYIDGRNFILDVQPGPRYFDGFEALAYSRSRYTSKRGDFDRAERQRLIIIALKEKILSLGTFANPLKISGLIDDFGNNVESNLSPEELLRLYEIGGAIEANNITSLGLADPPNNYVQTANIDGLSVVVPTAGIYDYSEIRSFVRNSLKDPFIKREDATIAVYNGTTIPGLAGSRAEDLESYGYNISDVANAAEQNYENTILIDLSGGQKSFTRSYLEKRLNTTAVTSLPADSTIDPASNDFVIILGRNESISQ